MIYRSKTYWRHLKTSNAYKTSGPSCSNLTMSLVNDSLKFTSSDTQICWFFFWWKMWVAFAVQKLLTFFSKNIRILCIKSAKTVNEMTLNELVKLTMLWTTGPWILFRYVIYKLIHTEFKIHEIDPRLENLIKKKQKKKTHAHALHYENMPIWLWPPQSPLLYCKTRVYRGIYYFSYFCSKT